MGLYIVNDKDDKHLLAIVAEHRWNARYKASEFVKKEYGEDISIEKWNVDICTEPEVIE